MVYWHLLGKGVGISVMSKETYHQKLDKILYYHCHDSKMLNQNKKNEKHHVLKEEEDII